MRSLPPGPSLCHRHTLRLVRMVPQGQAQVATPQLRGIGPDVQRKEVHQQGAGAMGRWGRAGEIRWGPSMTKLGG